MINSTAAPAAIQLSNLTKRYGDVTAVDGLSLTIPPGSIFGLLGTNGAGKTTTFKCLLGLARPTDGEVRFNGEALQPSLFERLSYMPERVALYEWMTGEQHLKLTRLSFERFDGARANELAQLFGLNLRKRIRTFSKGQQSAMAIVIAFSTHPDILVLDEPSSGLDPVHQRHVLDLMIDAAAGGATVLFSSHQIGQVERAADRVAILHRGKRVLDGEVEQLKAEVKIIEATFQGDAPALPALDVNAGVQRVMRQGRLLRAYVRGANNGAMHQIQAASPTSVRVLDQNLEDIFLAAVGDR
ncbi:MAG: ABC transporter ATP-binding protein [Candidatus Eremiobacter antarcticus]|nr:ABC transporter ATP-binding protein [Candidatus Eremiobacteraeota bacterium]MBC5807546.1 ABC transporter ATP-binding protein [Candidatus Eremiobacteraeota bacterium]